jgi:hypothetical protein
MSLITQDDETDLEISDDDIEPTGVSTLSSNMEEDHFDHQQKVPHLGQVRRDKSLHIRRVPLPKKWSHADTVIACTPLPNSRNLPATMAAPLLKRQKSSLLNTLSESDRAPSARALVFPNMSSGDWNSPQPKARCDQNVPRHQNGTFDVAKKLMEASVFTKTPCPILTDEKYSMVEEAWKLVIEA